jgi:hypothetical protein
MFDILTSRPDTDIIKRFHGGSALLRRAAIGVSNSLLESKHHGESDG